MRKKIFFAMAFFFSALAVKAQTAQQPFTQEVWPNGMPNTNGIDSQPEDLKNGNFHPEIRVFLPDSAKANGRAVVVCPGGGYSHLALDHEGYDWASFFNERGIALIVLKYRMPRGHREVPTSDAEEAVRIVRRNAPKWHIDAAKVGIMGSSAGGHLACTVATHAEGNAKPDFQILFYPVASLDSAITHRGTRDGFLGKTPTQTEVDEFSNELKVSAQTPPAIMLLSDDDRVVSPFNSVRYYTALKKNGVPASLHIYPKGGHGWGCRTYFAYHNAMLADLSDWLQTLP